MADNTGNGNEVRDVRPPPEAKKKPVTREIGGLTFSDEYAWLEDKNDPEVKRHLEDEKDYTDRNLERAVPLQKKIAKEIRDAIPETDSSAPAFRDGYFYYSKVEAGKQHPIFCRRRADVPNAKEEIILDENELAEGHKNFTVQELSVSRDHRYVAYASDTSGNERPTLYVKDLITGKILPEVFPDMAYSIVWSEDSKSFYYTELDSTRRPYRVRFHRLGTDPNKDDETVFEDGDSNNSVFLWKSSSREYIFIGSGSRDSTRVLCLAASGFDRSPRELIPRKANRLIHNVQHHGDSFIVDTNDGALDFKIVSIPVGGSLSEEREIVPHVLTGLIEESAVFKTHIVFIRRVNGFRRLFVLDLADQGRVPVEVPFDENTYSVELGANYMYDATSVRVHFTSLKTPEQTIDIDLKTLGKKIVKQKEVPSGYDPEHYETKMEYAASEDDEMIPISLVWKKGKRVNGPAPMVLTAYGGDAVSTEHEFSPQRLSLLNRGVIVAIAHIRGGGEFGRGWLEAGRLMNKKNSVNDFVACARFLVEQGYTTPKQLAAVGGSAGGLLMGAAVNKAPHLFRAVIAAVPVMDLVRWMADPSEYVGFAYRQELGDPNDPEVRAYQESYSPYDNIEDAEYPEMLVTGAMDDTRVPFWHAAKYVAKLRSHQKGRNRIYLKGSRLAKV